MTTTHVFRPYITVTTSGAVLLRFGRDAADAARSHHAYWFDVQNQPLRRDLDAQWEAFVKRSATQFLETNFKEY